MTRQRPRKSQPAKQPEPTRSPQPSAQTAEPISAAAPAAATLAADDHSQEAGGGAGSQADLTDDEPTGPTGLVGPVAPATELAPEPAEAQLTAGEAQPRPPRQPRPTKLARLQQLLRAPGGASLPALREATGWQAHTLRAALTRLRQAGHAVERGRAEDGATTYRIVESDGEPAEGRVASPNDCAASDANPPGATA